MGWSILVIRFAVRLSLRVPRPCALGLLVADRGLWAGSKEQLYGWSLNQLPSHLETTNVG